MGLQSWNPKTGSTTAGEQVGGMRTRNSTQYYRHGREAMWGWYVGNWGSWWVRVKDMGAVDGKLPKLGLSGGVECHVTSCQAMVVDQDIS